MPEPDAPSGSAAPRPRRLRRVLLIVLVVLIVVVAIGGIALDPVALAVVNSQLKKNLATEATLGELDIALGRGAVALRDLHIAQPPNYTPGTFLSLSDFSAQVSLKSLFSPTIIVRSIQLADVNVELVRNEAGSLNVEDLLPADRPPPSDEPKAAKGVRIESVKIERLNLVVVDEAIAKEPLRLVLTNITATALNLTLHPASLADGTLSTAELAAELLQPTGQEGRLGLTARLGAVGDGVPPLRASLRLFGLDLATVAPVLKPGVAQALGGDGLDIAADVEVAPDLLHCVVKLQTLNGHEYKLEVDGTPEKPVVHVDDILKEALHRPIQAVENVAANVAKSGVGVAANAADAGADVVKGAAATIGKFGGGLLKTVKGVAQGDVKEAAKGVKEATVESFEDAAKTVAGAGESVVEGVDEAGAEAAGGAKRDEWRASIVSRWEGEMDAARDSVRNAPFPPMSEEGVSKDESESK